MTDIPSGWVAVIVAVIASGGTVIGVVLTWLNGLNRRLRKLERRDRLSWIYIRSLLDHAYRHAPGVPLPEPPEGWLEDED